MPREDREREKEKKEEKKAKRNVRRSSSAGPSGSRHPRGSLVLSVEAVLFPGPAFRRRQGWGVMIDGYPPKGQYKKLGLNIAYYRKLRGYTQAELARLLQIDRTHMGTWSWPPPAPLWTSSSVCPMRWKYLYINCSCSGTSSGVCRHFCGRQAPFSSFHIAFFPAPWYIVIHAFPSLLLVKGVIMNIRQDFRHTLCASFVGYIVQAIINNFAPLLFLTFRPPTPSRWIGSRCW